VSCKQRGDLSNTGVAKLGLDGGSSAWLIERQNAKINIDKRSRSRNGEAHLIQIQGTELWATSDQRSQRWSGFWPQRISFQPDVSDRIRRPSSGNETGKARRVDAVAGKIPSFDPIGIL